MRKVRWIAPLLVALLAIALAPAVFAQGAQNAPAAPAPGAAPVPPAPGAAPAPPAAPPSLDTDKVSYAIGVNMGRSMAMQLQSDGIDINTDELVQGYSDALKNAAPKMSDEELDANMKNLTDAVRFYQQDEAHQKETAQKNLDRGKAFLDENAKKEGVKTAESGLQYKVIQEGTGKTPSADDSVEVNYRGRLINGFVFDSSYRRGQPATLPVSGVIPGWQEALKMMKEGAKWEVYIPADLGYKEQRRPGIPANSTLIFDVELLKIAPKQQPQVQPQGAEIPLPQPGQAPKAPAPAPAPK